MTGNLVFIPKHKGVVGKQHKEIGLVRVFLDIALWKGEKKRREGESRPQCFIIITCIQLICFYSLLRIFSVIVVILTSITKVQVTTILYAKVYIDLINI